MQKIGIEFEMAVYTNNLKKYNAFYKRLNKYGIVGTDGSIDINEKLNDSYSVIRAIEFKTHPIGFKNFEDLKEQIESMIKAIFEFKTLNLFRISDFRLGSMSRSRRVVFRIFGRPATVQKLPQTSLNHHPKHLPYRLFRHLFGDL